MTNPVNRVTFIGNLGADPETRIFENGSKIVKFPIAVNESFKKGDEWVTNTQWFKCECVGFVADKVEKYYHKGMKVFVEGRIKLNLWKTKEGVERLDVVVEVSTTHHFAVIPAKEQPESQQPQQTATAEPIPVPTPSYQPLDLSDETEDLPF